MANPIEQAIAGFASLFTVAIAYTVFGPIISNNLDSLLMDALVNPTGLLAVNAGSLAITGTYLLMAVKIMPWLVCAAVLFRVFVYIAFKTEATTYA